MHFPESAFRKFLASFTPPASTAEANVPGGRDTIGHSSVQAWSAGELFPAVISTVESYAEGDGTLAERLRHTSYLLILDGREERYASFEDAKAVARRLLADPASRAVWRAGAED